MVTEPNVTNIVLSFLTRVSNFKFKMSLQYSALDMEEIFHTLPDYNNHVHTLTRRKQKFKRLKLKES